MVGRHSALQAKVTAQPAEKQSALLTISEATLDSFAQSTNTFSQTVNCKVEHGRLPSITLMEFFEAEASSQHFLIMMADLSVHDRNRAVASYLDKKLACPDLTACSILPQAICVEVSMHAECKI